MSVNPKRENLALVFLKTVSHALFTMNPAAFRHAHEGVLFTADGHKAYVRGEKPKLLWRDVRGTLEPTRAYRIGIMGDDMIDDAVLMFYRLRPTDSP